VGDVDGDGYADLIAFYPVDKCIVDVSLNAYDQKSVWSFQARTDFGEKGLGACAGRFTGGQGAEVMAAFADGSVRLAWDFSAKDSKYRKDDLLGKLSGLAKGGLLMASGKALGDGRDEAVIEDAAGKVWLVSVTAGDHAKASVIALGSVGRGVSAMQVADFAGGKPELVCEDSRGGVWVEPLENGKLAKATKLYQGKPKDNLVAANIQGTGKTDLVVGDKVLWDGDPKDVSEWKELTQAGSGVLLAADMGNRGRDDLILYRREKNPPEPDGPGHEPYSRTDVFEFLTYRESDASWARNGLTVAESKAIGANPLMRSTSNDGLLDGWKVHGLSGFDFAKLGCSPLHKDVICEVQPQADVDKKHLQDDIKRIVDYYKSLPIKNADGTTGIHIVLTVREDVPKQYHDKGWSELSDLLFPKSHHGIDHWMVVYNGGGGQSSQMGDAGSAGIGAFWAVFIHEFGHQFGLDHTGFWGPPFCPLYPSLMNYAYSYGYDDDWTKIHYSDGTFKNFVLHETDLDETLPFPYEKVKFLEKGPYRFHLKPDGPNKTLIDWNWNGVFGEKHVKADIHYGYATTAGARDDAGRGDSAPWLLVHGGKAYLLFAQRPTRGDGKADNTVGASHPGALILRKLIKPTQWAEPVKVEKDGVIGDPEGISFAGAIWLFYQTPGGVKLTRVDSDGKVLSSKIVDPDPTITPTVGQYKGRLWLFLWNPKTNEVGYRTCGRDGDFGVEQTLNQKSVGPIGMAVDPIHDYVILGLSQDQPGKPGRWQIRRYKVDKDALAEKSVEWVEGEKGGARGYGRCLLLFDTSKDAGPQGRVLYYARGGDAKTAATCCYVALQLADKTHNEGWQVKRYYDEWSNSRSAPAAAWFGGDIIYCYRWIDSRPDYDGMLHVGYVGSGVEKAPLGDFDDIGFIANIGMQRSIHSFATKDALSELGK
jgi:hypothetical protein